MNIKDGNIEDTRQPPDEPEAQFCEDCGEEMEYRLYDIVATKFIKDGFRCNNPFCPDKFAIECGTTVIEMANHLVEVEQDLKYAKAALKYAEARIVNLTTIRIRREDRIEELENQIEELTRSQHE